MADFRLRLIGENFFRNAFSIGAISSVDRELAGASTGSGRAEVDTMSEVTKFSSGET